MAITTADGTAFEAPRQSGFWVRLLDRMAEGQMHKARAAVKPHLLALRDDELATLGYSREEIVRWENGPTFF